MNRKAAPGWCEIGIMIGVILCAAGTWLYASRILVPNQILYAASHGLTRGNASDLYPRWVGARELLLYGRDPYTNEVTRKIQMGFYGRVLAPDSPGQHQNYQQGFYYPVYIVFPLAPTLHLPFPTVQKAFFRILLVMTALTPLLWLRILRWSVPLWGQATLVVFSVGTLPSMQGLKLQQMTLVVAFVLALALWLMAADYHIAAGILFATATIKPQLVWLLLAWLAMWTLADLRRRYRWAASFLVTMTVLCAASEWYLPHWIFRFWQAVREYRGYTGEMSPLDMSLGPPWSRIVEVAAIVIMLGLCWRERRQPADSEAFAFAVAFVLAVTVFVVPSYGQYNQVLLLPALLIMLKERAAIWRKSPITRALLVMVVVLLGWQWFWCTVLAGLSFILPLATIDPFHQLPLWTVLLTPFGVAAAMLVYGKHRIFAASQQAGTS
jgi:hypothetical protein